MKLIWINNECAYLLIINYLSYLAFKLNIPIFNINNYQLQISHPTCTDGQSDVEVQLIAKKYVERDGSLTLTCKHNVPLEKIYKVTWLKGSGKIFEYINGREPPYRNFSVPGAEIDVRATFIASNLIGGHYSLCVACFSLAVQKIKS